MTPAAQTLLSELETSLVEAPATWRRGVLRRIADLFAAAAGAYTEEQIALFDLVIGRLTKNADRSLLAELSNKLSSLDNGPPEVLSKLAGHADPAVAGPVLEKARALPDETILALIDNDRVDLKLLSKIASRPVLSEAVSDVLINRGNAAIQRKVIENADARISEKSFAKLVIGINGDKNLAAVIAARADVPEDLQVWLAKVLEQ
jgi:uncharacterized protein (DUF2336 family)